MDRTLCDSFAVFAFNHSYFYPQLSGNITVVAHRGVHHTYDRNGLGTEECTADRLFKISHPYIENTIASTAAAFDQGADIVEADLQMTRDGEFVLFHDATLECKTDGRGRIFEHDLARLKKLDVGFGYTDDQGASYPLRGSAVGQMPTLAELILRFPDKRFIFDLQGKDRTAADRLSEYFVKNRLGSIGRHTFYGSWRVLKRLKELHPDLRTFDANQVKWCLQNYVATGWTGHISRWCRNTAVLVPINYARYLWGWPNLFVQRMQAAGTEVILIGPLLDIGQAGTPGLDAETDFARIPAGWPGAVWTNRSDIIVPLIKLRSTAKSEGDI
jgi:glycerophosphoryl diester phosphodiesterase